ncbi:DNA repair protein complementing XP-G cells like [Schistosoma japonicum]|nr:DNA repair protein complementing XP-G cells like [Schistosoma japonicum]
MKAFQFNNDDTDENLRKLPLLPSSKERHTMTPSLEMLCNPNTLHLKDKNNCYSHDFQGYLSACKLTNNKNKEQTLGIAGLWRLLEPAKEPIELQQLSGKIVAIDMNIWLHQAVKSRGSTNGPRNYLAIFFRRLCKLLFYGIKPVFVFDGDTPALKRSTMNLRRQSRRLIESKAEKAQKHLLRRLLRRVAESSVKSSSILPSKKTESFDIPAKHELLRRLRQRFDSHQAKEDAEMFSAPSNNSKSSCDNNNNILLSEKADAFCSLPLPAQLRVVQLMRETLDSGSCRNELVQVNDEAKFDPEKFSDVQMKRLLLRRRLAERQQELSDNLTKQEAIEQVLQLNNSVIKNILQNQSFFSTLPFCNSKQPTIESIETVATAMRIQLITYNAQNLNVSEKHDEAETSKDGQKEVINCDATGGNLCLVQETNMLVNKNIVYNFDCASIESPIVKEYSNETDKKIQYNDDCKNSNKSVMDKSLVELSSEILPQSLSDSDINKSLDYIEPFTLEHPDDLIEVKQNEITTKSGTSSDVHETEYFQVHEDDRHSEIKSSTGEDDDDFIDVDTDEHAEISSVSSDSNTLQNHSTDSFQNENEFNSVYSEKEFVSNEVVCYANRKEDILSSESYDDDYTEDDSVLRENADRLTRQAQSTTTLSPEEAEAQCVALQRHNLVDIVASDDSDVWPFGVKMVCRHLFGTGSDRKMKNNPSVYKLDEVRRKLGLTMANILRLTLLCGSDYTHGINQVGPVTAIEILSEFAESDDSLDSEINNWLHGVDKPSEELLQSTLKPLVEFAHWWQTTHTQNSSQSMNMPRIPEPNPVRRRWMNLKPYPGFPDSRIARAYLYPNVNINLPPFKWGSPCVTLLVKYPFFAQRSNLIKNLCPLTHVNTVLGWSTEKTESILSSVLKHRHSVELGNPVTSMPLLTNFFPTVNKVCEKSAVIVPSKRVRQAANRLRNQKTNNKTPKSATSSKDQDSLLSELPKPPRKCRGRETVKKSTNGAKALLKKRKEKPRIKPERRIVERVCLSEEDED